MDFATLVGIIVGTILVLSAILLGGDPMSYVDGPSMLIVIGGACAATLAAHPVNRFLQLPKVVRKTIFNQSQNPRDIITKMVELAEVARRDGILALENNLEGIQDPFLVSGVQMAVDGTDPEVIQTIMETELENLMARHETGKGLLESLGRYAPAFGMIGTLVGLVAMLSNMEDPSMIGSGMATALLTTMYGSLLANLIFLPLADKLGQRSSEELLNKTIIIQGVMAVQSGDNPRNVQAKLLTFLPPALRPDEENEVREAA